MMMTISELLETWNNIPSYTGGFLLISDDHPISFHIGYCSGEQKCFIVLNTGLIDKISSSKAIQVECVHTSKDVFSTRFLLNYPSLDDLFIKLCWDLMDSSCYAEDPINKIITQYENWQKLLQQVELQALSPSLQKGLIGELLYLDEKIDTIGACTALHAWVGSEGSDQDFIFEEAWSEVKSVSIDADAVPVSSLQQLERMDNGFLIIYFIDRTSAKDQHTISLIEIINCIRSKLIGTREYDELECKLAKYGYFDKDQALYEGCRYRLNEKRIYSVTSAFPRLTRSNVPSEIVSAKYDISLATINPFIILEE